MSINEEDILNLEKYTFSKYKKNNTNNMEKFSQFNSFKNKFLLNYQPSNNINNKTYSNKLELMNNISEPFKNKDINYNKINIESHQKSPLKNNNINVKNNSNLMAQYRNKANQIRNYNHLNNTNINNLDTVYNNLYNKKISVSKDNKNVQKRKFKTPDKYLNYNNFNYLTPNDSYNKNSFYNSKQNLEMINRINYNDNIRRKVNNRRIRKALTPDNTNARNSRNFKNIRNNAFIPINNDNNNNVNLKPVNFGKYNNKMINNNYNNIITQKLDNLNKGNYILSLGNSGYNQWGINSNIDINMNKSKYNYTTSIKNKTNYNKKSNINNIQRIHNKSNTNSNMNNLNKTSGYLKYNELCFNNRLPRGMINSVCCNKTPSPIRKNNDPLKNSFYNSKSKKPLKYTRSTSGDNIKQNYNKLKNNFKFKKIELNYSPDGSFINNSHKQMERTNKNLANSCYGQYKNSVNKHSIYSNNIYNSCGYNNSFLNDNKSNTSGLNDKNYNKTQPEFSKSLYNIGNINDINKIMDKSGEKNSSNISNISHELPYKYNNNNNSNNDYQSYNYKSYIESYSNESIRDNLNNKKINEINNKSSTMNFYNNINLNKGSLHNANSTNMYYFTKSSTNNNTFEENTNNSNISYKSVYKNNKMDSIEEVHINFVSILQNTKNMMTSQENVVKDKIIYNNINSTVVILEERDIE